MEREELVVRALVAGLLGSSLTNSQLKEVAAEIADRPHLLSEVGAALRAALGYHGKDSGGRGLSHVRHMSERDRIEGLKQISEIVGRKRMTKGDLVAYLNAFGSASVPREATTRHTMTELISQFIRTASKDDLERVKLAMLGEDTLDPYLKGITRLR